MNSVIVGAYWGDEGKGKIVDLLASEADWVVRYNGGDNAGHTLVVDEKKVVLHILPSGVLQGKNVLIGPDVFFNPGKFIEDFYHVKDKGFSIQGKIVIDERAHVIMPYHIKLDEIESGRIGSTGRGIGPAAKDKADRTSDITVADLISPDFPEKIASIIKEREDEFMAKGILNGKTNRIRYTKRVKDVYSDYASKIRNYVGRGNYLLHEELKRGKDIILEGAQGTLLDVVHGTRPYVTSSNTVSGAAAANLGIDIRKFRVIGIAKAYPTRVGEGPFPTELGKYEDVKKEKKDKLTFDEKRKVAEGDKTLLGKAIRSEGEEYGATTGRPRRVGLPDFVALRYAAIVNGVDEWALTKLDVLGGKSFRAATAYKKGSEVTQEFPFRTEEWEPVYGRNEYFWDRMKEEECIKVCRKGYGSLPEGMRFYIRDLVRHTGVPVSTISLSPKREITLTKDVLKKTQSYLNK